VQGYEWGHWDSSDWVWGISHPLQSVLEAPQHTNSPFFVSWAFGNWPGSLTSGCYHLLILSLFFSICLQFLFCLLCKKAGVIFITGIKIT
jgi:hypothetical protein